MSKEEPHDALNTVNLVTQCLCIPIVTLFVAMRFSIRAWYKQWAPVEDCMYSMAAFKPVERSLTCQGAACSHGCCSWRIAELPSWVSRLPFRRKVSGLTSTVGNYGGGYHYYDLDEETLVLYRKVRTYKPHDALYTALLIESN
jgi:hypothetical protein